MHQRQGTFAQNVLVSSCSYRNWICKVQFQSTGLPDLQWCNLNCKDTCLDGNSATHNRESCPSLFNISWENHLCRSMKRSLSYEPEVEHNFWFLLSLVCFLVCVWMHLDAFGSFGWSIVRPYARPSFPLLPFFSAQLSSPKFSLNIPV